MPKLVGDRPPPDVALIRAEIERAFNTTDNQDRVVANAKYGVYAFYDYDGEPIYVGQTSERLRTRIRRHLTNQRTDAVAMNVLDPFEVAEIEMWPFFELEDGEYDQPTIGTTLQAAEYTVFQRVLIESRFGAVLNEKDIPSTIEVALPPSLRVRIVPDELLAERSHPDVRIARRASTIANLARVISERQVSVGLRRTLHVQARRLEALALDRLRELGGMIPMEEPGEETGEASE